MECHPWDRSAEDRALSNPVVSQLILNPDSKIFENMSKIYRSQIILNIQIFPKFADFDRNISIPLYPIENLSTSLPILERYGPLPSKWETYIKPRA